MSDLLFHRPSLIHPVLAEVLERMDNARTLIDVQREAEQSFYELGYPISVYGFGSFDEFVTGEIVYLNNMPDVWLTYFWESGYASSDYPSLMASHTNEPYFCSKELIPDNAPNAEQAKFQLWEAQNIGLRCAYLLPVRNPYGPEKGAWEVASNEPPKIFIPRLKQQQDLVNAIMLTSHFKMLEIRKQTYLGEGRLSITPVTEPQHSILSWLACGLTYADIAERSNLSESGVAWHLDDMRTKLNVVRRKDLIPKAFALGILNPSDM